MTIVIELKCHKVIVRLVIEYIYMVVGCSYFDTEQNQLGFLENIMDNIH